MGANAENRVSTTQNTKYVICPFFVAHGKREIVCEGMIDGSQTWIRFEEEEDKDWHKRTYCEGRYKSCEMHCSIRHWKWPDDEE